MKKCRTRARAQRLRRLMGQRSLGASVHRLAGMGRAADWAPTRGPTCGWVARRATLADWGENAGPLLNGLPGVAGIEPGGRLYRLCRRPRAWRGCPACQTLNQASYPPRWRVPRTRRVGWRCRSSHRRRWTACPSSRAKWGCPRPRTANARIHTGGSSPFRNHHRIHTRIRMGPSRSHIRMGRRHSRPKPERDQNHLHSLFTRRSTESGPGNVIALATADTSHPRHRRSRANPAPASSSRRDHIR